MIQRIAIGVIVVVVLGTQIAEAIAKILLDILIQELDSRQGIKPMPVTRIGFLYRNLKGG